jgi:hypothetical protein
MRSRQIDARGKPEQPLPPGIRRNVDCAYAGQAHPVTISEHHQPTRRKRDARAVTGKSMLRTGGFFLSITRTGGDHERVGRHS